MGKLLILYYTGLLVACIAFQNNFQFKCESGPSVLWLIFVDQLFYFSNSAMLVLTLFFFYIGG